MYCPVIIIFSLTLVVQPTLAALLVIFVNPASSTIALEQICSSRGQLGICCIPLDLDINDGHGYGWFRAERVAFSGLDSHDTFTAVYRRQTQKVCSGEILVQRVGRQDWHTGILSLWSAGSALAVRSFRPVSVQRQWPDIIMVRGVAFTFMRSSASNEFCYKSVGGEIIHGRMYLGAMATSVSIGQANMTRMEETA